MAEYFPRANLIQGGVAPVTPAMPTVPLVDPVLKDQAAGFGTLSQRLDQFKTVAFKEAGARAKVAGAAYGASNAPTLEQVELAKNLGKPVDLPGDPSSISIFEQAAYAGSLAVTETNFTAAGRRALTTSMAEAAADPNMDPATFTSKMDIIVSEYAGAMRGISPSSAAKIQATLGVVANGQMGHFSRIFAANAKKEMKDAAYAAYDGITDGLPTIIHGFNPDGGASLSEIIDIERSQAKNTLIHGGESQKTVNGKMDAFDKLVRETKIESIVRMADDVSGADSDVQVQKLIAALKEGKVGGNRQMIYDSLDPEGQRSARAKLMSAGTAVKQQLIDTEETKKQERNILYGDFQKRLYKEDQDPDKLVQDLDKLEREVLDSNLEPKGDYGKQALLDKIKQTRKDLTTSALKSPTDAENETFVGLLDRITLPSQNPLKITAKQLREGEIDEVEIALPITGNEGVNQTTLIKRADAKRSLFKTQLDTLTKGLYENLKATVFTKELGKNQAGRRIYERAVAQTEAMIAAEVAAERGDDLLKNDLFKPGSLLRNQFLEYHLNLLPDTEARFAKRMARMEGGVLTMPKTVPFMRFQRALSAFGGNYDAAAEYLSKPQVFGRRFTPDQAEEFIKEFFGQVRDQ
jgi:hypothetical protein